MCTEKISIIIISAVVASVTTILIELIKICIKKRFDKKSDIDKYKREHDIQLFKTLNNILHEGILQSTMYAIRTNAEFYEEYIIPSDHYQLYVANYIGGKYINEPIETAHSTFLNSLKNFEKDLYNDFRRNESGRYKPKQGITEQEIKTKWTPIVENVLSDYLKYRKLIKDTYQL